MPLSASEIIAHRGASHDAPENTLAAFRLAWKQGADTCELDVHLSKDGEIIVIHDANTKRTAGLDKPVAEQTLAELRTLDAGKGEKLPTLAEAIALIPDGKRLFIEIKCGAEIFPALEKTLAASGKKPAQLVLISFHEGVVAEAKRRFPDNEVCWIVDSKAEKPASLDALLATIQRHHLDGLDLSAKLPIDRAFVEKANCRLYVWTVDDPARAAVLEQAGVHGITTNRPGWLREQMRSK